MTGLDFGADAWNPELPRGDSYIRRTIMKPTKSNHIVLALALLTCLSTFNLQLSTAFAQGTAFTYQGRLNDGGSPANGTNYGMVFYLYDAPTNGNLLGNEGIASVTASNGLFTVPLSFGNVFDGNPRWLAITLQKNGSGFTTLSPCQQIMPTLYAIMANTASNLLGTLTAAQLSAGTANVSITGNAATATTANNFSGSLSGDVTGTQGATAVANVGGQSAANVAGGANAANAATSAATANTIVRRDASGDFSAGTGPENLAGD